MIISKTPFRISFAGGGSDLSAYYRLKPGAVTSTTIDKYMYVALNKRFEDTIRVSYTKTEIVESVDQIQHQLMREALTAVGIDGGIEITTIADIPAGTGLGSSSSLTVGLLNALYAYKGIFRSAEQLAQEACRIEIEVLGNPIGKQDQYAVAYGNLNHIQLNSDDTVFVNPVICDKETKARLDRNLLLFYTGIKRDTNEILKEQRRETENREEKQEALSRMVELARELRETLCNDDLTDFGDLLHQNWEYKKQLTGHISNPQIDECYNCALEAGARGGKLLGAGGGGFLLFYCEEENQRDLRKAMAKLGLIETEFHLESQGSKIIYVGS